MNSSMIGIAFVTLFFLICISVMMRLSKKFSNEDKSTTQQNGQELKQQKESLKEKRQKEEEKRKEELREDALNLSADKILLRPVTLVDKNPLAIMLNNSRVVKPVGMERIKKSSQVLKILKEEYIDVLGTYAVVILSSMRIIGLAKLLEDEDNEDILHLTLILGKQFWRHGFGSEAIDILLENAEEQGAKEVIAEVQEVDDRIEAFLDKKGFKQNDSGQFVYMIEDT